MKKKAKQNPGRKPKKSAQHNTSYKVTLACAFLLPIVLALSLSTFEGVMNQGKTQARLSEFFKAEFSRQLTLSVNELSSIAPTLAKTPGLAEAILQNNQQALSAMEQSLVQHHPGLINVRIIKQNKLTRRSDPTAQNTSFTEQAMLRRIEKGDPLTLELSKVEGATVIRHGAPIKTTQGSAEGLLIGSILITLEQKTFTKYLSDLPQAIGYFALSQRQQQDKEIDWHQTGNAQLAGQADSQLLEVGNALWRLTYAGAGNLGSQTHALIAPAASGIITGILLALMVVMLRRVWLETVERNLQRLTAQFKANRGSNTKMAYTMPGFEACHRNLNTIIGALGQKAAASRATNASQAETNNAGAGADGAGQGLLDMDLDLADDDLFESVEQLDGDFMDAGNAAPAQQGQAISPNIFREYDIRGIVGDTLNEQVITLIGRAIGTRCLQAGDASIVMGRDGRNSSESLAAALSNGLTSTGCNVIDVGMVPTPLTYFAAKNLETSSAVMITGSHNPPNYNGLKIVIKDETLHGETIQELLGMIEQEQFADGAGNVQTADINDSYQQKVAGDMALGRSLKVVVDAGNGVAGPTMVEMIQNLGCEVVSLYCDVDGNFPNHHPDPSNPDNLQALIQTVQEQHADVGLALDGDGDRLGVVTPEGKIIFPDRLLMLYAKDILARNPGGEIIFDIKCTSDLHQLIASLGGRPIMWKTGHSLIKAKLKETGALIAGEMSGHIFFNDRWYGFDDAIYSAARLLEILSVEGLDLDGLMATLPERISTPEINIPVTEDSKFTIMDALSRTGEFRGNVVTLDGIRVDYSNGWGLVRASNTTPNLVARFEADTDENLKSIQDEFRNNLLNVEPKLGLPF